MIDFDLNLLRLQYEILNCPIEQLASQAGVPASLLQEEATTQGWTQWWPADDKAIDQTSLVDGSDLEDNPEDDTFSIASELYAARLRKRLTVYNLAKEQYLAIKYLRLESALVDKATALLHEAALGPQDVKNLSALFKDLTSKLQGLAVSMTKDESGLPTAIIRDLSGN